MDKLCRWRAGREGEFKCYGKSAGLKSENCLKKVGILPYVEIFIFA
jgi:hypothetical protein